MHFLYTDQNNTFNCQVEIEGADVSKSFTRLIVETPEGTNLLFTGVLSSNGECDISLPNVKKYLSENSTGKLKLEVIVEDNIFVPWESDYFVKASKKVTVKEVKSTEKQIVDNHPKINVKVSTPKSTDIIDYHMAQLKTLTESVNGKTQNKDLNKIFEFYQRKKLQEVSNDVINQVKTKFLN